MKVAVVTDPDRLGSGRHLQSDPFRRATHRDGTCGWIVIGQMENI